MSCAVTTENLSTLPESPVTTEEGVPFVFEVVNLDRAQEKIAKLAKRAAKLKVAAPSLTVVGSHIEYECVEEMFGGEVQYSWSKVKPMPTASWGRRPTGAVRTKHHVVLTGIRTVKLGGWTFLATLDHELGEDNTVIRMVPGNDGALPTEYRHRGNYCDHCRRAQARKQTFVVRHEDGRLHQVGSTCIKDFLGNDAVKCLAEVELAGLAAGYLDEGEGHGRATSWDLTEYLAWVCKEIRENGFVSRKEARDRNGVTASSDAAFQTFMDFQKQR